MKRLYTFLKIFLLLVAVKLVNCDYFCEYPRTGIILLFLLIFTMFMLDYKADKS